MAKEGRQNILRDDNFHSALLPEQGLWLGHPLGLSAHWSAVRRSYQCHEPAAAGPSQAARRPGHRQHGQATLWSRNPPERDRTNPRLQVTVLA